MWTGIGSENVKLINKACAGIKEGAEKTSSLLEELLNWCSEGKLEG